MSDLNWQMGLLREISLPVGDKWMPSSTEGNLPYVGLEHISPENPRVDEYGNSADVISTKNLFRIGDTLFGKLRPYLKKVALADRSGVCSTDIIPIRANSKADPLFVYYLLSSPKVIAKAVESSAGNVMPRASWSDLADIEIKIPPLPEQKKIAEILSGIDLVLEKINALSDKQEILHKSLLIDLMTGGIGCQNIVTEKKCRIPEEWKVCTLGSIFSLTSGKSKPKNLLSPAPVPGYVIPVYGGNGITGYATESLLESSTITIGRVGEYCGAVHLTPRQSWVTDNALYINKKVSDFNLRFMYYFLSFCDLSKLRKQGGQPLVSQKPIMELEVALPPLEGQIKIARIMDSTAKKLSALRSLNDKVKRIKMSVSQDLLSGCKRVTI